METQDHQVNKGQLALQEMTASQALQAIKEPTLRSQLAAKEIVDPQDHKAKKAQSVIRDKTEPQERLDHPDHQEAQDSKELQDQTATKEAKGHWEDQAQMLNIVHVHQETALLAVKEPEDQDLAVQETAETALVIMVLILAVTRLGIVAESSKL